MAPSRVAFLVCTDPAPRARRRRADLAADARGGAGTVWAEAAMMHTQGGGVCEPHVSDVCAIAGYYFKTEVLRGHGARTRAVRLLFTDYSGRVCPCSCAHARRPGPRARRRRGSCASASHLGRCAVNVAELGWLRSSDQMPEVRVIATDIDGTVFNSHHEVPAANASAMRAAAAQVGLLNPVHRLSTLSS